LEDKVRTPQFQALPFAVRAGFHGDLDVLTAQQEREPSALEDSDRRDTKE
jgi:hypothetical protein